MITLELTEQQLDELYDGMSSNDSASNRKRCLIVYLRAKRYPREVVADIARVDPDSVTHYVVSPEKVFSTLVADTTPSVSDG